MYRRPPPLTGRPEEMKALPPAPHLPTQPGPGETPARLSITSGRASLSETKDLIKICQLQSLRKLRLVLSCPTVPVLEVAVGGRGEGGADWATTFSWCDCLQDSAARGGSGWLGASWNAFESFDGHLRQCASSVPLPKGPQEAEGETRVSGSCKVWEIPEKEKERRRGRGRV